MNRRQFLTVSAGTAAAVAAPKPLMALAPVTLPGEWFAVWPIKPGTLYWSKPIGPDWITDYPEVPDKCIDPDILDWAAREPVIYFLKPLEIV